MKKSKIAIFHYSGPPNTSGVDVIIYEQAQLFKLYGYKPSIVAGLAKQFHKDIPVKIIPKINPKHPLVLSALKELEKGKVSKNFEKLEQDLFLSIKKYIIQNKIQVCILHNLFTRAYNLALTSALNRIIKEFPNIVFIIWVHDVVFYNEPNTHLKKGLSNKYPWSLLTKLTPNATYVCVSGFLKNNLLGALNKSKPSKVIVIPNGQNIEKFLDLSPIMQDLYKDIDGTESDLIACIPVRAVPRKNLELAIQIAYAIVNKGINFKLLLTANIDYKRKENIAYHKKLKQLVKKLKLEKNVFFLEEYFNKKSPASRIPVSELFLISDFLLFTSKKEGFGLPIIEAGLMKCPIFASNIDPFCEIGSKNINYFSLDKSPEEIANFIIKNMRKNPQARLYREIIKKFSIHKIFEKQILPIINKQK